jgi:hypothetical protein
VNVWEKNDRRGNSIRMTAVAMTADDMMAKNKKFTWPATDTPTSPTSAKDVVDRTISRVNVLRPS